MAIETAPAPPAVRRRSWAWVPRAVVGLVALAFVGELVRIIVGGNFHVLVPGRIYRSAQPSPADIKSLARDYGVRTVVNLRGRGDGMDWYEAEARACQSYGLVHENLTFSASRLPSKYELRRLVEVLDRAETPLLIHCRQGADRTGLASAVAMLLTDGVSYVDGRAKMGLRWGHWHWGPAGNLSKFFEQYEAWLAEQKVEHSATAFRRWATEGYLGDLCQYEVVRIVPMQEVAREGQPIAFRVTFRNASPKAWQFRSIARAGIHLGVQAVSEDRSHTKESRGGLLDKVVGPGQEIELIAALPHLPRGRHRLRIDLIEEGHGWFHQFGQEPIEQELNVQ